MNFEIHEAIEILERTPQSLEAFLSGVSKGWMECNEGEGTWTVPEVIDHLILCEKTNWIPRLETILQAGQTKPFPPFDRYAHLNEKTEQPIERRLKEFKELRELNVAILKALVQPEVHLELSGNHPAFGAVRVRELIAAWAVHDLTHISQIVRVMANRYRTDVGPWIEYLSILNRR